MSQGCQSCEVGRVAGWERLGLNARGADFVVALAGNPNVGKSTLFNALTGLRQHTGNWPGKTIARAEGAFGYGGKRFKVVDLPGTYSLLSASPDEEVARDFILFGRPDVTVVVVDATRLERNLNLVLQVLQITGRVVVAVNLVDEARAHGLTVDCRGLARDLGVPVVACVARQGEGVERLLEEMLAVATGVTVGRPRRLSYEVPGLRGAMERLTGQLRAALPELGPVEWVALRLLEGDRRMAEAVAGGELGPVTNRVAAVVELAEQLRWQLPLQTRDKWVENVYAEAARIAGRNVSRAGQVQKLPWERRLDWLLTSRWTGFPVMVGMLALVLWITIAGSNVPSQWLSGLLVETVHPWLRGLVVGWPAWLSGVLVDGMYLTTAWVVSVMLPPMAIFFPLFTILEDFGYLPRVAFNLDNLFRRVGAHGKQALTMCMGFGCNAAGVVATRIIDSPRERLIAILTNNFSLCNGRWPTQILIATVFLGALAPPALAGVTAAAAVLGVALLGVGLALLVSWLLTGTVLKGEASTFSLELPPYRPPRVLRTLYTSLIDRTLIVLWRAVVFAMPAGVVIWLVGNVEVGGLTLAQHLVGALQPLGWWLGLNGVILLAYVVAIPANEIVIPTILMLTVATTGVSGVGEAGAGVMFEAEGEALQRLFAAGGWTTLTGVCLMLFSLCHNPCSTTIFTIWKETRSVKWTALAVGLPVAFGVVICATVAWVWRMFA